MSVCLPVAIVLIVVLSVFNTIWIILHHKENDEIMRHNVKILDRGITMDCSTCVNNDICKYRLVFEQLLKCYKEAVEAPENNWLYMVEPVCLRRREV